MNRLLVLWLFATLLPNLAKANYLSTTNPPGCDTLITTSGQTYLVLVGWEGEQEIQYRLCEEQSGRVYSMRRDSIRELKRQKTPVVEKTLPTPSVKYNLLKDSFDLLTLTNGKTYRVILLVKDYLNTYYRLYDDPADDRQYVVPNRDVRSLRFSKNRRTVRQKKNGCLIAVAILLGLLLLMVLANISN